MNSPVINSQNEQPAPRAVTPELIAAFELAVEHWADLTPIQRENAFRLACEHLPKELHESAFNRRLSTFFDEMTTTTAH